MENLEKRKKKSTEGGGRKVVGGRRDLLNTAAFVLPLLAAGLMLLCASPARIRGDVTARGSAVILCQCVFNTNNVTIRKQHDSAADLLSAVGLLSTVGLHLLAADRMTTHDDLTRECTDSR